MIEEKKPSLHPISSVLCALYETLADKGEVAFRLYDEQINRLDSVVKTVHATYFGFPRFPTPEDKAAAYFTFIIKDHPVVDGNKRLAVFFLELFCQVFKLEIRLPADLTLDQLAVAVEQGGEAHTMIEDVKRILFNIPKPE